MSIAHSYFCSGRVFACWNGAATCCRAHLSPAEQLEACALEVPVGAVADRLRSDLEAAT